MKKTRPKTTLQAFKEAFEVFRVRGYRVRFHSFHWGQKPTRPTVYRSVKEVNTVSAVLSSAYAKDERGSWLYWPKASELVEHAPGVFWVLNDVMGDVLVYDFAEGLKD